MRTLVRSGWIHTHPARVGFSRDNATSVKSTFIRYTTTIMLESTINGDNKTQ